MESIAYRWKTGDYENGYRMRLVFPLLQFADEDEQDVLEFFLGAASELLKPYDAQRMRCYPITRINHVANDDELCSAPVDLELAQIQARLFS